MPPNHESNIESDGQRLEEILREQLRQKVASSTSHDRSGIDDAVGKDNNDGLVIGSTLDASVDNDFPSSMPPNHESNIESDGQHSEETLGPIRHHDSKCSTDNSLVGPMSEDMKAKSHFDGSTNISKRPTRVEQRLFELLSRRELTCCDIPNRYRMEYGKKLVLPQNPSTNKRVKLSDFLCSIEGVQKFGSGNKAWFVATRQTDAKPKKVRMAVYAAIKALADPKGSSILQIQQYIEANNTNSVGHNRVCGALKYGVAVGTLIRLPGKGFYKLAPKNRPKKATPNKVRRIIDVDTRNQVGGRILITKLGEPTSCFCSYTYIFCIFETHFRFHVALFDNKTG